MKKSIFNNLNFKSLWFGSVVSSIGDQLSLLAIPWLILSITGDPLQVGIVLSTMSIPRALFTLFGGVYTDKYNPLIILKLSRCSSILLNILLIFLIYSNSLNAMLLTGIAFGLGLSSAFSAPASMSILPMILDEANLKKGNSLMMINIQLSAIIGPFLAGILLSINGEDTSGLIDRLGYILVFSIDSFTFLISLISYFYLSLPSFIINKSTQKVSHIIFKCFHHLKNDKTLTFYLSYIAIIRLFPIKFLYISMTF